MANPVNPKEIFSFGLIGFAENINLGFYVCVATVLQLHQF